MSNQHDNPRNNKPNNNTCHKATDKSSMPERSSIEACAITFIGNAKNKRQQDAFYLLDTTYQTEFVMTPIRHWQGEFCVAVSDGLASSPYAQHCSKAVVKAVAQLNASASLITPTAIHMTINRRISNSRHYGASATLALVTGTPTTTPMDDEDEVQDVDNSDSADGEPITGYALRLLHIGDSRIYYLPCRSEDGDNDNQTSDTLDNWRCLTRDHNMLNELLDEQAKQSGQAVNPADYNRAGMASSLYGLTECFTLEGDSYDSQAPSSTVDSLHVNRGDHIVVCSDGIHDLIEAGDWPALNADTKLDDWLQALRVAVYESAGKAYDNGTAIVIRFH